MPWKTMTLKEFTESLGLDYAEHAQKHALIKKIISARKRQRLSQAQLAKKVGVSQVRIARIESGLGTYSVSFEALFKILAALGYYCRISVKKGNEQAKLAP